MWQEGQAHVGHLVDGDHHAVADPLAQHGDDGVAEEGGGIAGAFFLAESLVGPEPLGHGRGHQLVELVLEGQTKNLGVALGFGQEVGPGLDHLTLEVKLAEAAENLVEGPRQELGENLLLAPVVAVEGVSRHPSLADQLGDGDLLQILIF